MIKDKGLCIICNSVNAVLKCMCEPCYRKDYFSKNRDKINESAKLWARNNSDKTKLYVRTVQTRFNNVKSTAKSRKLLFTITKDEYFEIINKPCYYCDGFFPMPEAGGGLDRLNNKLGYHVDNVVSCCTICNQTRNDNWSPEEMKIMIKAVIDFKKRNNYV